MNFKYHYLSSTRSCSINNPASELREAAVCPVDELVLRHLRGREVILEQGLAVGGVHGRALLLLRVVALHPVQVLATQFSI